MMEKCKIYDSIVDPGIQKDIEGDWCKDLFFLATCFGMDALIAAAHLFCPEFIEIEGYVFLKGVLDSNVGHENLNHYTICDLEEEFNHDKKKIEMYVNMFTVYGSFFIGDQREFMGNEKVLKQFSDALIYFWSRRLKELFPEKNMRFVTGYDMFDELGYMITFYEEE